MLKNTQSGRSMIEMLGVLAIIGVLSAGGIAGYSMAMKNYKANKAMEVIQMLSTQAKTIYNGNYTNISANDMTALGSDFTSPFGEISVAEVDNDAKHFTLTMLNVEQSACIKLGAANWGGATVKVDGNAVANMSDALTSCNSVDDNTVVWTFD